MKSAPPPSSDHFQPRRSPRQARSGTTVEAIFEATIQVLLKEGLARLTTIRVAERAGVSVGTLYQYFPNKQALQYAILVRHFDELAVAVEGVRDAAAVRPLAQLADDVARAYIQVKTARPDLTQALYRVAAALQQNKLTTGAHERLNVALRDTLTRASDATMDDAERVARVLLAALAGLARAAFEGELRAGFLESDAAALARAYLAAVAMPRTV
ncbi:MAG: hypothetical protein RJA98_1334 [Pseudomonadota bacterium]